MVTVSPPTWAYALQLPHDPRAARIARATVRAVLAGHGMDQLTDPAELLVSELVTNTYRHAAGTATLRLRCLDSRRLRVSVWDANPDIPPPFDKRSGPLRSVPVDADGGRGLFLVSHYAVAWGGYPLGDDLFGMGGKLLWCELAAA
jgi:anti-sigma regulatory factor (Ser/Thr protein kinase)